MKALRSRRAIQRGKGAAISLGTLLREFYGDGGMFMAASISYYALLSLVPLIYFFINTFAYFIGASPHLQTAVFTYVKTIYPMLGQTLTREITRVMQHTRLGWISLVAYLWLGSLVFISLEYSVNMMFRTQKKRHFIKAVGVSAGMVILSGFFMAVSFWVAYIPTLVRNNRDIIPWPELVTHLTGGMPVKALSFILVFLSFSALYKVLPNRKVKTKLAVSGGLIAATLWEASKYAFAWYLAGSGLSGLYGSLSAIIMFLVWIFYSAAIFLLVAKLVYLGERGEIT